MKLVKNPIFLLILSLFITWSIWITTGIFSCKNTSAEFENYRQENVISQQELCKSIEKLEKKIDKNFLMLNDKIDKNQRDNYNIFLDMKQRR